MHASRFAYHSKSVFHTRIDFQNILRKLLHPDYEMGTTRF